MRPRANVKGIFCDRKVWPLLAAESTKTILVTFKRIIGGVGI